jgi:hypothetical protein
MRSFGRDKSSQRHRGSQSTTKRMEGIGSEVEQHSRWGRNSSRNREPVGKGQSRCRRRETRRRVTEEMALDESRFKVASRWFEDAPGNETIMVVSGERRSL